MFTQVLDPLDNLTLTCLVALIPVVSLLVMAGIQILPGLPGTGEFWHRHIGVEIFWPWYALIGSVVCIATAAAIRPWLDRGAR